MVTALGFYVGIEPWAWMGTKHRHWSGLIAEGINTAIERLADVYNRNTMKNRPLKDMSAGFVSIAALTAFVIAAIIYAPKLGLV